MNKGYCTYTANTTFLLLTHFLKHQNSHCYAWYKWNDITFKSQIDYILIRVKRRFRILDAKAIPNRLCEH